MANGRTERKFNNPRMDPKVVSQTMEHVKDATIVNNGMPDDEGFFEAVERHTQSPIKTVSNPKNGYNEFESLMNELKNGGDVDTIRSQIKGNFRDNTQKYMERYIQENYQGNQYAKDVDTMLNGDPDIDGYYEAIDNVNKNKDTDLEMLDNLERDSNGAINIDKVVDDVSNGRTTTINGNTIINNKHQTLNTKNEIKNRRNQRSNSRGNSSSAQVTKRAGANNVKQFENIINKRNKALRIEELKRKVNDKNLTSNERRKARQDLVREYQNDQTEYKRLKDRSRDQNLSSAERKRAARQARDIKRDRIEEKEINRLNELKKRANDTTLSKKERKKARKELLKEKNSNPYYNTSTVSQVYEEKILNTNKNVVDDYIKRNESEYNQFNRDLDAAGSDYLDIDGNELDSTNKKINTTLRKAELKLKGFFKGDYSEYDEYVEAVERLENMKARDFEFYDTDNLFNSNGHLNSVDDLDNLKPSRTVSAKDAFDDWQTGRKNARAQSRAAAGSGSTSRGVAAAKEAVSRSAPNAKKLFTAQGAFGVGLNLFNTVATYKEERKEGKGVISSAARAGVDFALGEVLGMKYMGVMAAQAAPRAIVKGIEGLGKLTREKNNMQRHEAFGYASFQDTQQLATMRQSGMEMAKMANYNLQQTLMGNEAKYMHR